MLTLTDNPDIYPPSILDLTISSDNVNSTLATVNDTITINLIVNEKISTVSSTVLGDTPIIDLSEKSVKYGDVDICIWSKLFWECNF